MAHFVSELVKRGVNTLCALRGITTVLPPTEGSAGA